MADTHHAANAFSNSWVHIGPWLNWSKHPLSVLTYTTTREGGLVLNSFLTLFITACGAFCWCIFCFVLHQARASKEDQDGHFYQTQALLRNSAQDLNTLKQLLKMGYAWHKKAEKNKSRIFRLCLVALLHLGIFEVAALLANRIYGTNNEVLIRSDMCGKFDADKAALENPDVYNLYDMRDRLNSRWAVDYARNCYKQEDGAHEQEGGTQCKIMASSALTKRQDVYKDQRCPFDPSICLDPEKGAVAVDSGVIDTNEDLGLNSHRHHSVGYRRVTTCAPLRTDGFVGTRNAVTRLGEKPGDQYTQYSYGPTINGTTGEVEADHTFELSAYLMNLTLTPYQLATVRSVHNNDTYSNFRPISLLQREDADVTLLAATMGAWFEEPINDLFYQANTPYQDPATDAPYYISAGNMSMMGCTEQHQFCLKVEPGGIGRKCTKLQGYSDAGDAFGPGDKEQWEVANWLYYTILNNRLSDMARDLSGDALLANLYVGTGHSTISAQLPQGQWQQEIVGWHEFIMARMQKLIVEIVAGPQIDNTLGNATDEFKKYVTPFTKEELGGYDVCSNIKVVDANFYSWNIVGVVVVIIVGILIILTSLFIEPVTGYFQRRTGRGEHKHQDWVEDHVVHIQRHAFEKSVGHVPWTGHEKDVPTTENKEKFGSLARHSVVRSPGTVYSVGSPKSPTGPFVSVQPAASPGASPSLGTQPPMHESGSGYFQGMPPRYPPGASPV